MLTELPKIFGRPFLIGYFLPSVLLVAGSLELLRGYGIGLPLQFTKDRILADATMFGVVSWFGGILLLLGNLRILRLMEGYGRLNPARLFQGFEIKRFAKLQGEILKLRSERESCRAQAKEFPSESRVRLNKLARQAAERYPDQNIWLLPTPFGNAIRAFEVYPRVMYGLEGIQGWTRLLAVIPKEYLKFLDDAKAQMDSWANLFFASVLIVLEYVALAMYIRHVNVPWFMAAVLAVSAVAFRMAQEAAIQWGELIKASFDVFLPDLRKRLEFPPSRSKEQDQELWTKFSQAIVYRLPRSMPEGAQGPAGSFE